jgi:hypothetical protein
MVLGAGGYRNLDFVKFGGPMQIWMLVVTSVVLVAHEHWKIVWIVTGIAGFVILAAPEAFNILHIVRWAGGNGGGGGGGAGSICPATPAQARLVE